MSQELEALAPRTQDRGVLARMVMQLMDLWNLNPEQQAGLLGLDASSRSGLAKYRKGSPIGTSRDQLDRVSHLLGIHKNPRLLFPQNSEIGYRWWPPTTRPSTTSRLWM